MILILAKMRMPVGVEVEDEGVPEETEEEHKVMVVVKVKGRKEMKEVKGCVEEAENEQQQEGEEVLEPEEVKWY